MGPRHRQPPLPDYHWCIRPHSEQSQVRKWIQESNYTQGVEGSLDSVHSSFLHRAFARADRSRVARFGPPRLMTLETDFGFVYGARYAADDEYYWRITSYTMPLFTQVPNSATAGAGNFVVPMDDENSWWWYMTAPALAPGEPVLARGQLTPGDPIRQSTRPPTISPVRGGAPAIAPTTI
jgi:hypothetical protein